MFDNIAQLENEVQEFQKNILASKELLEQFQNLIDAIKKLSTDNENTVETVRNKATELQNTLTEAGKSELEEMDRKMSDTISDIKKSSEDLLKAMEKRNDELLSSATEELNRVTTSYSEHLSQMDEQLKHAEKELAQKYRQFTELVETCEIDKIPSQLKSIQKKNQIEFGILLAGLGIVLVLSVLSFVL